nr:L protein [Arenavirus sp.]
MDESVSSLFDLLRKHFPAKEEISRQVTIVTSQTEMRMILTEGFKLLSLLIELDSCEVNNCSHNNEDLTVEAILSKDNILTIALPRIVPDGYSLYGNVLILLETFVRVNPSSFEQKYNQDMNKLLSLKNDLQLCGITLVPLVDGRTNYYNKFVDDWVIERFRWLLTQIMKIAKESGESIEELEYQRLVTSLSKLENQSLGFENINKMPQTGIDYRDKLKARMFANLSNKMRESEINQSLLSLKLAFDEAYDDKSHLKKFQRTDKGDLIFRLGQQINLSDDKLSCMSCSSKLFSIVSSITQTRDKLDSHVMSVSNAKLWYHESGVANVTEYLRILSVCNKIKSAKILNTRRNTLLFLDMIVLNFIDDCWRNDPAILLQFKKSGLLVGQLAYFVNDRLFDLLLLKELLSKKLKSSPDWIQRCLSNIKRQEFFDISGVEFWIRQPNCESIEDLCCALEPVKPKIQYCKDEDNHENHKLDLADRDNYFTCLSVLSSVCLGLVNSMKTSFTSKMVVNERSPNNFYGEVELKECYCQRFYISDEITGLLFYQKTGEKSRCYSIGVTMHGSYKYVGSFYCDPKRFFLPIFSQVVLFQMTEEMMSWLPEEPSYKEPVIVNLRKLILMLLCNPSKRNQNFLQGMRYFIMAYVNQFHSVELMNKLEVPCKSVSEECVQRLTYNLLVDVLTKGDINEHMTRKFKFCLNVSYLCHLITKETPDRLTDQIKCFEKFLEPKLKFKSVIINPDLVGDLTEEQEDQLLNSIEKLLGKSLQDVNDSSEPGISRELLSMCISAFNRDLLRVSGKLKNDPYKPNFTSTALDLSSNKSVVIPKLDELGNPISKYDYELLVSSCIASMAESFKTKGKYKLDPTSQEFLILKNLYSLMSKSKRDDNIKDSKGLEQNLSSDLENLSEEQVLILEQVKRDVNLALSKMKETSLKDKTEARQSPSSSSLKNQQKKQVELQEKLSELWSEFMCMKMISVEVSLHEIKDFDPDLIDYATLKSMLDKLYSSDLASEFFLEEILNPCPLEFLVKNMTTSSYLEGDLFECFKYTLITAGFDQKLGTYEHRNKTRLGFKFEALKVREEGRMSLRESNSEAIARRLDKSVFSNSALRNLCFYSDESPISYSHVSSDTGKLKFGLSYKEQVGSNRELYVGDLNTKLMTRLIEDFSESVVSNMNYSCLNSEKEFERSVMEMKMSVNLGEMNFSLDHSKWGPYMSPVVFAAFLQGLKLEQGPMCAPVSVEPIITLLSWHIHKVVEVPYNVIHAYMTGMIKRQLGLMSPGESSKTEAFIHRLLMDEREPLSHVMSVLDMGQGILHNTSDLYGLVTEQFINYALRILFDVSMTSFTSSDDQITMVKLNEDLKDMDNPEVISNWERIINFHTFISSKFNKFVSPKTVIGTFAAEFKSRFFVWGEEVPLLTKFVSAALHNIKCKTPIQLSETIDTISDQCVANGVSVEIVSCISNRTNKLIRYSGFPDNPFLSVENMDVKDWVDGNRGYRLQRNIESHLEVDGCTKFVRQAARKVFRNIKSGKIMEQTLVNLVQEDGDRAFQGFMKSVDVSDDDIKLLQNFRWINLSTHGDMRLVLRTKLMSSRRIIEQEEIPGLIKSIQSKLSKNFVRGAKRILADSINKSAFQSSIASGFIGFCKSMGSKCVRLSGGGFGYIKDIKNKVKHDCLCDICFRWRGCVYCPNSCADISEFCRPLMWDYFTLVLTNACELGEWVFEDVEIPKDLYFLRNPNLFWLVKPRIVCQLEERLGLSHILQSIRKNYPTLFEMHLSPFMSDFMVGKTLGSLTVKFLDLCVALDLTNENLGITKHFLKERRHEIYVVKQDESSQSHIRNVKGIESSVELNSMQVCNNFLTQLLMSSFIQPLVLTSSVFKKFNWFAEVLCLNSEEEVCLKQLTDFVLQVKKFNVDRAMHIEDLSAGYISSTINVTSFSLSVPTFLECVDFDFINNEGNEPSDFKDLLSSEFTKDTLTLDFCIQVSHIKRSVKFNVKRTLVYTLAVKTQIEKKSILEAIGTSDQISLTVSELDLYCSGHTGNHFVLDAVPLIYSEPLIAGSLKFDLLSMLRDQELFFTSSEEMPTFNFDFSSQKHHIVNKFAYKLVGPSVYDEPLVLNKGVIYSGERKLTSLGVEVNGERIVQAMGELDNISEQELFLTNLWEYSKETDVKVRIIQDNLKILTDNHFVQLKNSLKSFGEWLNLGNYMLCYSKSLDTIMISDVSGRIRLKGVVCRKLIEDEIMEVE